VIVGIIVGHQDIGAGLIKALDSISGPAKDLYFLSNNGLSTRELAAQIEDQCENGERQVLIFVDVYGGSCWRAAKMARMHSGSIVTGLNLPMLLSFVNKRLTVPFEQLPAILAEDGKRGITYE
jgi:mannose/fructose-specific phosphotransferase system component IIA